MFGRVKSLAVTGGAAVAWLDRLYGLENPRD